MSDTNTFLSLVKNTTTNVSAFVGNSADPCFTRGLIEAYPTVFKSGTSFYFDFSESGNSSDLKFLKKFFDGLANGNTFTISGGTYYSEDTSTQYNFNGTYALAGKTGTYNEYLNFTGQTYSSSLFDGVYANTNFTTRFNFVAVTGATCQYFISRVNKDNPFNLNFLGIYGNDYGYEEYLELVGSSANTGRLKLNTAIKLNDKSEILYVNTSNTITNENFYFVPVTANIYMRGVPDLSTLASSTNLNGILKKINPSGSVLQIFDNQNLRQRYCRAVNDSTNYYDWYSARPSANYENLFNPIAYDKISVAINYYSLVQIAVIDIFQNLSSETGALTSTQTLGLIVDGVQTSAVTYSTTPNVSTPTLKIDLSDSSLFGAIVEPFIDAACSVPLGESYFLNGVPGFDGASFIYLKKSNMPAVLYLKFVKDVSMVLQITLGQ
jgi:hypothetical protein